MSESSGAVEERIADAALALVAQHGFRRTTLADIARAANCGRATIYRVVPGGKAELLEQVARRELERFLDDLVRRLDQAASLEDALVIGLTTSARAVRDHAALQYVLNHEPDVLLPFLGFRESDRLYAAAAVGCAPHLARFLGPDDAGWAAEWVTRIVVSYSFAPADSVDLTDEADARALARLLLMPGFRPRLVSNLR
jgi:AcrR family transcriptional regulator